MPGSPRPVRSRSTAGVITPRFSAISGQLAAQRAAGGVERRAAGPARPAPAERVAGAAGHRPVGGEAAEVVDPREVEELERAAQAVGPPAVAAALQRAPVVQRVAPQLALVGVRVGRRAGDGVGAEQLGVRAVVDRPGGDVDRHVADQPHAALRRVRAQRRPLALEPHLVGDRAARAEPRPVLDPVRVALAEVELLGARDPRPRLGQQPAPRGERRRRPVGRAVAVRRPQREHLPPRLPGLRQPVDEAVRLAARGGRPAAMSDAAGRRWNVGAS